VAWTAVQARAAQRLPTRDDGGELRHDGDGGGEITPSIHEVIAFTSGALTGASDG
jgi:hypothetical protein